VPGLGVRIVNRIVASRRHRRLRFADLQAMGASLQSARYFIVTADHRPVLDGHVSQRLRGGLVQASTQQSLF
jgi:predicted DNA-binding helix-hairpin-helix protein